jgi:hypothetical protein
MLPGLFQYRIKLLGERSDTWGATEREQLLNRITVVDTSFVNKFEEEVRSVPGIDQRKISDAQRKIPKPKNFEQDSGEGEAE